MSKAIVMLRHNHKGPIHWNDILEGAEIYNDMYDLYGDFLNEDEMHSLYHKKSISDNEIKKLNIPTLKFINDYNEFLDSKTREKIQDKIDLEGEL